MTDSQTLLAEYVRTGSETAFRELVARYVDLVHSTALRLVEGDNHRAEDVAQTVFVDLSRMTRTLSGDVMLGGWLHRHTCFVAANTMRGERRRQSRERQAVEMNALQDHSNADFSLVAPFLDEAINELGDADRMAVLLRFFEQHDFRSVGEALGSNEDAARMRVTRALEKLEHFLKRRGVTTSAATLGLVLGANAVQAAPVGLAVTISAATALAGTTIATAATATAVKTIAMTTLQKTIIGATLAVAIGAGVYEAHKASTLKAQVENLQNQQSPFAEQLKQLNADYTDATNRLVVLRDDNERLNRNTLELLKLRGEIGVMRSQIANISTTNTKTEQPPLTSATQYYERSLQHQQKNEFQLQVEDLNMAIGLDPDYALAYKARASVYIYNLPKRLGGEAKAAADYTRYLELRPEDYSIRHNRGLLYERLQQYDDAISDYTVVIESHSDSIQQVDENNTAIATTYFFRGQIYQTQKHDYLKAVADYTAAIRLNPQNKDAYQSRGQCYELLGETEKAQQDFAIEPKQN